MFILLLTPDPRTTCRLKTNFKGFGQKLCLYSCKIDGQIVLVMFYQIYFKNIGRDLRYRIQTSYKWFKTTLYPYCPALSGFLNYDGFSNLYEFNKLLFNTAYESWLKHLLPVLILICFYPSMDSTSRSSNLIQYIRHDAPINTE